MSKHLCLAQDPLPRRLQLPSWRHLLSPHSRVLLVLSLLDYPNVQWLVCMIRVFTSCCPCLQPWFSSSLRQLLFRPQNELGYLPLEGVPSEPSPLPLDVRSLSALSRRSPRPAHFYHEIELFAFFFFNIYLISIMSHIPFEALHTHVLFS